VYLPRYAPLVTIDYIHFTVQANDSFEYLHCLTYPSSVRYRVVNEHHYSVTFAVRDDDCFDLVWAVFLRYGGVPEPLARELSALVRVVVFLMYGATSAGFGILAPLIDWLIEGFNRHEFAAQ
jgi:hypothetical protein